MASFLDRAFGAAKLDAKTYEEVKRDTGATGQASPVSCRTPSPPISCW